MADESKCRISKKEARVFAVLAMSVGLPVGVHAFRMYFKSFITKERALELEAIQASFRPCEIKRIRKAANKDRKYA